MNEPANFGTNEEKPWNWPEGLEPWSLKCPGTLFDDPPYLPIAARPYGERKRLSDKTMCMIGEHELIANANKVSHYNLHSLYGWSQTEPTLRHFFLFLFIQKFNYFF